jgi:phosphate transport system ATP-binding protein
MSIDDKITIRDLNLWYTRFHALKAVNMPVRQQHITALIGPSGCGKSTLLRCLNRMNDLVPGVRITGEVLLDNANVYSGSMLPDNLRKRVGMVFQRPNPFPLSVFANVVYGLRVAGVRNRSELAERPKSASAPPGCGTISRTNSTAPRWNCRWTSSSASASPACSPSSRKSS